MIADRNIEARAACNPSVNHVRQAWRGDSVKTEMPLSERLDHPLVTILCPRPIDKGLVKRDNYSIALHCVVQGPFGKRTGCSAQLDWRRPRSESRGSSRAGILLSWEV